MHVGHEGVEMDAALRLDLRGVEEQIHQHRLAAPDRAADIEAARRLGGLRAEQSREAARLGFRPVVFQFVGERVEFPDERRLRRVGLEPALGNERAVTISDEAHALVSVMPES